MYDLQSGGEIFGEAFQTGDEAIQVGLLNQAEAQAAEGSELVGLALPEQGQEDLPDEGMVGFARGLPTPTAPGSAAAAEERARAERAPADAAPKATPAHETAHASSFAQR